MAFWKPACQVPDRNEPRVCDTGGLVWRLDEDLMDATTKRQYAAIDELPNLRRFTEAELRLRSIILGSPEVPRMHGLEMLTNQATAHIWPHAEWT